MARYYLRLEAVNLGNFISDTQDLSTIRGGNLLLLRATERLSEHLADIGGLREITTGASIGLYEFEAVDDREARSVRDRVESSLRTTQGLRYATMVVDVQEASSVFTSDVEALTSSNRWRQMQSLSVVLDDQASGKVCEVDKVRPAVRQTEIGNEKRWVSQSVLDRRGFGLEQKKREFYREEAGGRSLGNFVSDLEKLASDPSKGNLHRKIAIIYLDGNRFGIIKDKAGNSQDVWRQFDQKVRDYRRQMLSSLLDTIGSNSDWQTDGAYRIETLLWGGDEITWVVPAWKGWEALSHFYRSSQSWEFEGEPLLHAAGIVFCHHNAPIHRLIRLAHNLAEQAKLDDGRNHNRFGYEVLESFDHVGSDFAAYRKTRCVQPLDPGKPPDPLSLLLDADAMQILQQQAQHLREKLPSRKLHDVVESLLTSSSKRASIIEDFRDRLKRAGVAAAQLREFEGRFATDTCWLHLHNLWDYII